jgi:DNA-binding CsgD family transcriptional regulator
MAGALSDSDLRTMSDLLAIDPEQVGSAGLPEATLVHLGALIDCDLVSFFGFDAASATQHVMQDFDGSAVTEQGELHDEHDPFFALYWRSLPCSYPARTGDWRSVTTLSDFCSQREWRASPMYAECLSSVEKEMMCCLGPQGERARRVLFFRGDGPDFDDRDRLVMTLLRPHLSEILARRESATRSLLTPRQTELLALVAAGRSTGQIAASLHLSPGTVRKHLENIFERLGVTSRTAAVMRVFAEAGAP